MAVPRASGQDGLPAGATLIAPAWHDHMLAGLGRAWQRATGLPLGARGLSPARRARAPAAGRGGDGPRGGRRPSERRPADAQLQELGGRLFQATRTAGCYRLYALPDTRPPKPGLTRRPGDAGTGIEVEVWSLSGVCVRVIRCPITRHWRSARSSWPTAAA